jgi:hypothetical protein
MARLIQIAVKAATVLPRRTPWRATQASLAAQEHDPEKWKPVFPKRSCSTKKLERQSIQSEAIVLGNALERQTAGLPSSESVHSCQPANAPCRFALTRLQRGR